MAAPETISEPVKWAGPAFRKGGLKFKNARVEQCIQFIPPTGSTTEGALSTTSTLVSRFIHVVNTPATVDRMFYMDVTHATGGKEVMYVISTMTATSGNNTAGRFRAESAGATKTSGETYGVHAQGIANEGKAAVVVNAIYGEAIAKPTSTVTYLRGGFFAADSEGTPTTITNMTGVHIRVKTSKAVTTDFMGLIVETEKFGAGIACDSMILIKDATWGSGSTIATNGLAFATTGDFTQTIYTSSNCTYFIKFSANTAKGFETGSLKDSDNADIKCDGKVLLVVDTTAYWLAAYNTVV